MYAIDRILYDWAEERFLTLLTRIHAALPPGGAARVAESVLQSLGLLLVTEGQERTLGEFAALLERVGLRDVACRRTSSPLDAVLGVS